MSCLGDALLILHAGVVEGREDRGHEEREQAPALHFINQVERRLRVVVGLTGVSDHKRQHREPIVFVRDAQALEHHAWPLVNGEGHAFARHDFLRHAHRAGLEADERRQDFLLRVVAHHRDVDGALGQKNFREFLDEKRVRDERRHGGVAQHVLLDAGRIYDRRVKVQERFAVGEEEWRSGPHLAPDEHVFGGQRNLFVALGDVRANSDHDLFFGHVNLRVQVGHAELAPSAAARGHFDHAESRAPVGHENPLTRGRVRDVYLARQVFTVERLSEKRQGSGRLAPPFDDRIHAQLREAVGLRNLPAARPAHDDFEIFPEGVVLDAREHLPGVEGIDGLSRRAEDGRIDAGGERHAERVVRRNGHHARVRPDEPVEIVRVTRDHVVGREFA